VSTDPVLGAPGTQEPLSELFGAVYELADEAAARVSPDEVGARLRRIVRKVDRPAEIPPSAVPAQRAAVGAVAALVAEPAGLARPASAGGGGIGLAVAEVVAAEAPAEWDVDRAVTALYSEHYRSLVRLAALLVRDIATAEEVVQDSFVAMHGGWRRLRDNEKALSYLRQSVVNRSRSVLRHRVVVDRNAPKPPPDMPSAEHGAITLLERSAVVAALRTLPPRQREALVLRYYGDLSEAQIAGAMGISKGAVKSHTARAMIALRSVLEREA
jgi:RNA polymerase sigma-70 factor (sigma-E family)